MCNLLKAAAPGIAQHASRQTSDAFNDFAQSLTKAIVGNPHFPDANKARDIQTAIAAVQGAIQKSLAAQTFAPKQP